MSVGIDLKGKPKLLSAQEVMVHRHLYAHNLGLVDEHYIKQWRDLTGENIRPRLGNYPNVDGYWFEPLEMIANYIEDLRKFVASFP